MLSKVKTGVSHWNPRLRFLWEYFLDNILPDQRWETSCMENNIVWLRLSARVIRVTNCRNFSRDASDLERCYLRTILEAIDVHKIMLVSFQWTSLKSYQLHRIAASLMFTTRHFFSQSSRPKLYVHYSRRIRDYFICFFPLVQDETWDTSSAFFNHAAKRGPAHTSNQNATPETTSATTAETNVDKHAPSSGTNRIDREKTAESEKDPIIERSRHLAGTSKVHVRVNFMIDVQYAFMCGYNKRSKSWRLRQTADRKR